MNEEEKDQMGCFCQALGGYVVALAIAVLLIWGVHTLFFKDDAPQNQITTVTEK